MRKQHLIEATSTASKINPMMIHMKSINQMFKFSSLPFIGIYQQAEKLSGGKNFLKTSISGE
ncbi:hypothetical protein [Photobacterium sp. R1]